MANNSSWGNSGFSENSFFTLRNCLPDAGLPLPALTSASFLHLCCPGRGPAYLSLLQWLPSAKVGGESALHPLLPWRAALLLQS